MNDSLISTKITKVIAECELHQQRITYSLEKLKQFMPLDSKKYQALSDEQVEALDQFLFRFAKLQDAIGQRLFVYFLESQAEPVKDLSVLDRLNRLEQLGVLPNKDEWLSIRNIRNKVSHEYEDNPVAMCKALNHVYAIYPRLSAIFLKLRLRTLH